MCWVESRQNKGHKEVLAHNIVKAMVLRRVSSYFSGQVPTQQVTEAPVSIDGLLSQYPAPMTILTGSSRGKY